MHPHASLHHSLPAGMRKTWLIFLTPCVEFYRLSCAPASQIPAQTKMAEGVICLTAHQTEASCFCCWGAASCFHEGFGESLCSQFPPSCFFSFPPLLSPQWNQSSSHTIDVFFLGGLILKSYSFIRPPSGIRVWLSVTDPERSRLILHKDRAMF